MVNPKWNKAERDRRMASKNAQTRRPHVHPNSIRARAMFEQAEAKGLRCFKCLGKPVRGEIAKTGSNRRGAWFICVPCVKTRDTEPARA